MRQGDRIGSGDGARQGFIETIRQHDLQIAAVRLGRIKRHREGSVRADGCRADLNAGGIGHCHRCARLAPAGEQSSGIVHHEIGRRQRIDQVRRNGEAGLRCEAKFGLRDAQIAAVDLDRAEVNRERAVRRDNYDRTDDRARRISDGNCRSNFARTRQLVAICADEKVCRSIRRSRIRREHHARRGHVVACIRQRDRQLSAIKLSRIETDLERTVSFYRADADRISEKVGDDNVSTRLAFAGQDRACGVNRKFDGRCRGQDVIQLEIGSVGHVAGDIRLLDGDVTARQLRRGEGDGEGSAIGDDPRTDDETVGVSDRYGRTHFTRAGQDRLSDIDSRYRRGIGGEEIRCRHQDDVGFVARCIRGGHLEIGTGCLRRRQCDGEGAVGGHDSRPAIDPVGDCHRGIGLSGTGEQCSGGIDGEIGKDRVREIHRGHNGRQRFIAGEIFKHDFQITTIDLRRDRGRC
ncbi:hypothetical protein N7E02_15645 [Aliirhizobium terrae]|nr:hypothetical protein [Rhizobium sp. CC-CFT758]WJH41718.1 hypothetical protein N7E02_15645 [Rhizobium sp. CC-CFT758]